MQPFLFYPAAPPIMTDDISRRTAWSRLLDRATRILAMRDHSEQELRRKLAAPLPVKPRRGEQPEKPQPEATPEEIEKVIAWCYEHSWLDDARFAAQFIASRGRKGYGPQRIRQELQQKGISRTQCDTALSECEIDWVELAREQAERKFGSPLPKGYPEKAKVQRFLLYRGYYMEDIQDLYRNFAG